MSENIKTKYIILCEYASLTKDNRVNMLGVFDSLVKPHVDKKILQMAVVSSIPVKIKGHYVIDVKIFSKDDSNKEIFPKATFEADVNNLPESIGVIARLDNFNFPKADDYRIMVFVNNNKAGEIILPVTETAEIK